MSLSDPQPSARLDLSQLRTPPPALAQPTREKSLTLVGSFSIIDGRHAGLQRLAPSGSGKIQELRVGAELETSRLLVVEWIRGLSSPGVAFEATERIAFKPERVREGAKREAKE